MSLYQVASRFLVARYVAHSPDDIISIHPKAQGVVDVFGDLERPQSRAIPKRGKWPQDFYRDARCADLLLAEGDQWPGAELNSLAERMSVPVDRLAA